MRYFAFEEKVFRLPLHSCAVTHSNGNSVTPSVSIPERIAKEKLPFVEEELPFSGTQTNVRVQQSMEGFCAFR